MISTQHTQSLTDFRQKATETLDRLNQTGEAEILTVNGEARAVLLSPAAYDELARDADPSEPCFEPPVVEFLRQVESHANSGDLEWLKQHGKVYAAVEAA